MGKISVMIAVLMLSPDSHFTLADVATVLAVCTGVVGLIVGVVKIANSQTTLSVKQQEHKAQIDKELRAVHKRIDSKADEGELVSANKKLDIIIEKLL